MVYWDSYIIFATRTIKIQTSHAYSKGVKALSVLQLSVPPMPYFIVNGFAANEPGFKHPNRRNIGVFDMLLVRSGCLYIAEEDRKYEVSAGDMLILRPDKHHYPTAPCQEETLYYWLHFQTSGEWRVSDPNESETSDDREEKIPDRLRVFIPQTIKFHIPQSFHIPKPAKLFALMDQMIELGARSDSLSRWKQQTLFQNLLERLHESWQSDETASSARCADQAASYLRQHYHENVSAQALGEALNFHPVYIARCMQKQFGCSPFEYLMHYRLEQAKLLLLQTDLPITRIADDVGFNQAAYFTSCFVKYVGATPREYRRRFQ